MPCLPFSFGPPRLAGEGGICARGDQLWLAQLLRVPLERAHQIPFVKTGARAILHFCPVCFIVF